MELPYDPVITLLGIFPKKLKTLILKNICTPMLIAALFIIAKIWKQPNYPQIDEWVTKVVVHICNGILLDWEKE